MMSLAEFDSYTRNLRVTADNSLKLIKTAQNACAIEGHTTTVYPEQLEDAVSSVLDNGGDSQAAHTARIEALTPFYESYKNCSRCKSSVGA